MKIERVDSDDSVNPKAKANPSIIVKKGLNDGKNHEEMKVSFATPTMLQKDRPKHQQSNISLKKSFECTFCRVKFSTGSALIKHRDGSQLSDGVILCPVRRKQLSSLYQLFSST